MKGVEPTWLASIVQWARADSRVAAVFLFGSRAKGTHRPDSDLDLAVVLTGDEDDSALGYSICKGDEMQARLAAVIPVSVHVNFPLEGDTVVWPAVQEHGQLIYAG
jgi:predicted nucleotidyltransferase